MNERDESERRPEARRLVCVICRAAHFDGPGTDGTVSLAEPPVSDHQPVYEAAHALQVAHEEVKG